MNDLNPAAEPFQAPAATPAVSNAPSMRDLILQARDINEEELPIPEWGVTVKLRGISAGERNDMTKASRDAEGAVVGAELQARICVAAIIDPASGMQVFGPGDLANLQAKSAGVIDRISQKVLKLSNLGTDNSVADAVAAAGKVS